MPAPRAPPPTLAVSADWLNGSLSFVDLDALLGPGGTPEEALISRVELASDGQGPLSVAITPDGSLAVVLLSQGVMAFVGERLGIDADTLPNTGAAVVIVDVVTQRVVADFPAAELPIMTAIDARGDRAFVSFLGGPDISGSIAVYDLASLEELERVEVAPFVEGIALNDAGTMGAAIGATSGLYLFDPADLAGSLSRTPLRLADDSSGVVFAPGTDRVVVANSRNPRNYVVIDATDPDAPVILEEGEELDGVPFMIAAVPGREEVVMPVAGADSVRLLHLDVSGTPARALHDIDVPDVLTFPQVVTVDPTGRYVFIGAAASRQLLVFDLEDGGATRIDWLDELGPTALAVVP